MEIKIEIASSLSMINPYLPVLNEFGYKEEPSTIYLNYLHDIFDLVEKLRECNHNGEFEPSIIVEKDSLLIYDDWIE